MAKKKDDSNFLPLLILLGVAGTAYALWPSNAPVKPPTTPGTSSNNPPGETQTPYMSEPGNPTSYIGQYRNAAQAIVNAAPSPGISLAFILSQSGLETGWGQSELFKKANNAFGVTADSTWTGNTWQQTDGSGNKFGPIYRAYATVADSFADYLAVLLEPQYAALWSSGTNDPITWAEIIGPIYDPTDANYSDTLLGIIPSVQAILQQ